MFVPTSTLILQKKKAKTEHLKTEVQWDMGCISQYCAPLHTNRLPRYNIAACF